MDLPDKYELPKESLPPVMDQGELGSSTACATAHAIMFDNKRPKVDEDHLLIYYSEREI